MTVLGGARSLPAGARPLHSGAVRVMPQAGARPMPGARRRLSHRDRATRRAHPIGVLMAGVLIAFMLGLIYLAQTISLAATNYEIDQLAAQRDDLYRQVQTIETSVLHWGSEPTVLERAQRLGLDQLPDRVRLPAR
ncbi:hypothetical protein BH24CHL5_BH24CHL5_00670 [soil metagenome]